MITSSAVVGALFLRLKVPSAAVGFLSSQTELAEQPWRIWTLVLVLLGYQLWRFLTDPAAKLAWDKTAEFFAMRFSDYASESLRKAVYAEILGRRRLGYPIELMGELPEGIGFDRKRSSVGIRVQDTSGAVLPWKSWAERNGRCQAPYELHEANGTRVWSSAISAKYVLPSWQPALWYLHAAHTTIWRSPDCQDLLVPVVLAAIATGGAVTRILYTVGA